MQVRRPNLSFRPASLTKEAGLSTPIDLADATAGTGSGKWRPPVLSIITAALNALPGLKATADSLRVQTFRDFEHIVVDGGSSDGTPEWLATQPQIRWISEPDGGIAEAMNKGVRMARGEKVLVLHAGDTLYSKASIDMAVFWSGSADIGCFEVFHGDREIAYRHPALRLEWKPVAHQGVVCRRALFQHIGLFDESYRIAMDYEWLLRAKRAGARFRRCPVKISRMDTSGISSHTDWASLAERFAEERRAQMLHCTGPLMRGVYALYWPPYLAYRWLRSVLAGTKE